MKIAFVIGRFPSLSETFILDQITGLIDRGHEIDIYADETPEQEKVHKDVQRYDLLSKTHYLPALPNNIVTRAWKGIKIISRHVPKHPYQLLQSVNISKYGNYARSMRLLYAVSPLLGTSKTYDVIHCHFGPFGVRGAFLRDVGILKGRLVTTFHGADITSGVRHYGNKVYERLFEVGDLFLPISNNWKNHLIAMGCPDQKIKVHRMGINCKQFEYSARSITKDEKVRLISVCRLVEKKGIEYAIRAVLKLIKEGINVQYDIIGDGPLRNTLESLTKSIGSGVKVKIHGWKDKNEVIRFLNDAHVLLAPSITATNGDQEGIPVALMEAMAMGLPVISTRHSGIPELIENDVSGILVDERDVESLFEKLLYLITTPSLWRKMGKAGRVKVETEFDIRKLNDELVSHFASCSGRGI